MNKTLTQAAFFFSWMASPVVLECLLMLSGINIWDDCKQQGANLLPSCRNQCCYISKSVVSVYANQDSGEAVVSFCWAVLPFNTYFMQGDPQPNKSSGFATAWHGRLLGFRDPSMPVPSCSRRNQPGFIYKTRQVSSLNLLKPVKEIGFYLATGFQWNLYYCCLSREPAPPFMPFGVKWCWVILLSAVIQTTFHIYVEFWRSNHRL